MNRLVEVISGGVAAGGLAYGAVACGGGDNAKPTPDDIKSPTATVLRTENPMPSATDLATKVTESPTPVITEAPTIAPTPIATEKPLYGPAPSMDELRASLVPAFGEGNLPKYFERDIELCSDSYPTLNSETVNTENEALQLLSYCLGQRDQLRNEGVGGTSAINNGLDQLRDSYFSLLKKLVKKGLLSQAYLEPGQVQHRIDLDFSHIK